jgi:hypothetical protein
MASSLSFSITQRRTLLSPPPTSPVNSEEPLWTSAMRLTERRVVLHLRQQVRQEQHLSIAGPGDEAVFGIARVLDHEARIADAGLAAHALLVALPAFAVGRVRQHEIEFA